MMIRNLFAFCLALILSGCGGEVATPTPYPEDAGDRAVFVNYWAEWCAPCREEIPELNAFQREHADAVLVYGVNFDGISGEELEAVEQSMGIGFPTLSPDPGPALGWPQPEGLPYTFVTDAGGRVLARLPGVQTRESLDEALATFRQARKEEP